MRRFVVLLCVAVSAQGQVCNGGPTNVPAGATAANFANCNALSNGATCNPVTGYGCSTGYTPDALAAFVLACPAGTYDASAARCTANSCVGGLDTPTGAQVSNTVPTTITTGNDLSAFVTPQTGYSCAGSRNAVCTTGGNNRATVATYVCTGLLCSSVGSVTGATTLTAGSVRTGDALTMQQQNGYRCTGTAIAQCMTVNSVAGIVGYTCGPAECTGGITAPTGASVTGTPPAVIKNGDDISVYLQAQAGYSCLGNPQARAVCTTSGITAVSVTAYTCTALSCASLSAPTGTAVIVQRATATNTDVTANLQVQTGYSCSGTALAMCNTANGVASVTGYSCSTLACASFQAPTGAQIVTQQGVNHNQVLTGLLQSAQGYTCSGTPRAVCGTANGAAGVSGYACVPIQCQTFNVPNGADIVAQRASSTGDDLSASISPTAGYTCQGTPRALCTVANGAAGVTGYTCQVNQCQSIGALVGATITTQGPATTGDNLSGRLTPAATSQCTGTPVAVCNTVNGAASVTGYTCSRNRCSSITAPPGATVTLQRAVDNGEIVTANLQSSAGYACTGVATAVCSAQNGAASVTGYTCTQLVCATIGVPTNGRVTQQRTSSTGDNLSPNVGPLPGYTCTGTPISSCSAQNGVALVTGYTCAATTCSSFAVPTGAQATAQTAVSTGQTINANLQAQNGYTCSGTATVFCPTVNNVATVSGYTCVATFQCSSFNAPAGAQVTNPGGVNDGQVVTGRLSAQNGYTCSGTAVTSCPVGGGAASVTGYTCSAQCNSLSAPPGSTVTAQGATTGGQVVTGRLTAQQGYTCSGTATAVCTQVGGTASVSGYTCIATTSCASLAAPPGSNVVTQGATTNGANVLARLAAQPGYSCAGQASASCMQVGGVATVTGTYTCTLQVMCAAITAPTWAVVTTQGGVNNNQDVTAWLAPQQGYTCTGTARTVCTQQGATASVTGYTCVLAALQCSTLTSPTGAQVTTQGAVTHGQDVTGRLSPAGGYVCTGTATAVCNQANGAASTTGYSCTAMQCASFSSPNGAQVTSQGSVTHTQDVTTRLTALQGYTCSGTGRAQCTQQGGVASVTGYTCNLISMCASFTAPPGAQATTQGGVNNNQDITAWLTAQQGYTCTGTARTVCTQQGGTASVTGYTCSLTNMCTAFTAPPGAQATTQGGVNNNQDITAWLTAQQGYTCTGTARTVCTQQGGTASVTGYTCSLTKMCTAFTAPPGAQVTTQGGVNNNQDVTAWLTPQQGYTCTGTAMTVCTQQGATASVTGYTCALIQCSSLRAPAGAQVTTQGSVSNNQDVTGRLSTLPGYVCTGTATSLCTAQNAVATITGFSCTTVQCASFAAPPGAQVTSQGSVNNNQDLTGRLSPLQGYTCTGTATATCLQQGGTASVTGYTCTTTSLCSAFTPPVGSVATTQGGVNNNQDITAWLTAQQGYTCSGTASTVCTQQGGTAGVTGYTCTLTTMCASFTAPIGSQVTTQGGVNNNQDITAWLTPQQGYTCAGTARTVCTQQGGTASVTGYTCTTGTLCSAFTPPVGSVATTQGGVNNNQDITAWLAPQQGYTCTGTARTVCTQQGATASVTGYTCTTGTTQCVTLTAPPGAQVTASGNVNHNQDVSTRVSPQQGYTCSGTAIAVCTQQGGSASTSGYTCTLTAMCASFTAPMGAQVTTPAGVNNNQDVTAWLAPQQGYTCTGTARTVCTQQGATASVTGYTCTTGVTQCNTLTAPTGAQVTASGSVNNGQDVTGRIAPQQGYTCTGTATAMCTQQGGTASTSGYTCTLTAMCASFTTPAGAQVTTQGGVNSNQDITAWLAPQQGYTCTGTAMTVCTQQGGIASVTGYSCTFTTLLCNTLTAPPGAQVTTQGGVNNNQDVTVRLSPMAGYTCTGTARALCTQQGGIASTTGYVCTSSSGGCTGFTAPVGSLVTSLGPVTNGQDVTARLTPQSGYTCSGVARAECVQAGSIASVRGYTCSLTGSTGQCASFAPPAGAQVTSQGSVTGGQDVTARITALGGYVCSGTAVVQCTQGGGVGTVTGYVCIAQCQSLSPPSGAQVATQGAVVNGEDVTGRLAAQSGYVCVGTGAGQCGEAGGVATVTGFSCSPALGCSTLTAPPGAVVVTQGQVLDGQDVTSLLQASAGSVCSGTARASCGVANGGATVQGYTCSASGAACTGGLEVPSGAARTSANLPAQLTTGADVSAYVQPAPGYACVGAAVAVCPAAGSSAVAVTGYTCGRSTRTCAGITAIAGTTVTSQGAVGDGADVGNRVGSAPGYTCTGSATAVCAQEGAQAALAGYYCTAYVCSSLVAPVGAAVTTQGTVVNGEAVSGRLGSQPGYTCTGNAVAQCVTAGGAATVSGYTCVLGGGNGAVCTGGVIVPAGSSLSSALPASIATGTDLTSYFVPQDGFVCVNRAVASCPVSGSGKADVTQFTCVDIPSGCTTPASYPGYAIGQGQRTIQCAAGYAGAVSITCPSGGGQMVLSGCTPSSPGGNVCALPASTNGYAIAGGSSCTTVGACGTVTCLPGYRTVGTPRVWCVANGGAFTLTGCAPDGTPVCSAPALPGYVVGACTVGVTCTNVQCASGYSSVATAPRVVCGSDGGVLVGEGCVQSSAVASLPTRPWKRVRMSVVPQWPLLSTEQMSSFITSLEQKLALSYYRFERSLAELRITLMCPADVTPTDQTCYRPKVEWRPYSTVQQTTAQPPQIIDIIVADDTHELVDEDIRNLKLQVDNAVKGTGPIATGRPDLPLVVDPTRAFSTSVPDQLGLVTAPSGGTPILTLSPNTDDDDDSFPWWAILLITLAALLLLLLFILLLCCCCGKKKSAADTRATEKEKEHRGYYDDENHSPENPLDAMYATPSKPKSLDSYDDQNSSAAEAIRARQLREEIYVLEKQRNALESQPPPSRTSSIVEVEEVEYIDASSPPRALTHRWLLGDEVEVLYAGQWYPATIASSGPDPYGAWDVDWGDGTGSRFVAASDIRPPGGWSEYTTVVY